MDVNADGSAVAADTAAPEASATSPAAPAFVNADNRTETVALDWPIEYDGKVYAQITVRRMSVADMAAFAAKVRDLPAEDAAKVRFPMFDAPDAVIDTLDLDDNEKVDEVVQRFLPSRFRAATA